MLDKNKFNLYSVSNVVTLAELVNLSSVCFLLAAYTVARSFVKSICVLELY